ncbi:MAG: FAD-dependent oxidoreductase [Streptosporangiales bacterium]|nr:FAD-dependent oxidoreductase [Streptosporangiales bacterium]MBO0889642.1 FAD-dependent oxidoreductase [Acidothermales bacterium]
MTSTAQAALSGARPKPFWLDDATAPDPCPQLVGDVDCDLAVVGGGYTGLWTALMAKERDPDLEVVLVEGRQVGWAASGRNGGFCSSSLTHGLANGIARFPDEMDVLERLGNENLDGIARSVDKYGIDCTFERTGELTVATEQWQVGELAKVAEQGRRYGQNVELLDRAGVREEVDSPTYLGGLYDPDSTAMLNPAKLAWGLRDACLRLGVRIYENTRVYSVDAIRGHLQLPTPRGRVACDQVAIGTAAFPPLLQRIRAFVLPVYDYVLVTEPLSADQLATVGWKRRSGVSDSGNQFHYYRLTDDNRILWGGYDAVYHYNNSVHSKRDQRPATFHRLAEHFFATFPQLTGVRFTHTWGGVTDTCSRFCAFFGGAHAGRLAYAAGFTGLGVGASRFAANVMLDRLLEGTTELTELRMVRSKPVPFPPEPLRYGLVALTRWSLARADARDGRRNLWLRGLDRFGIGFDS